MNKNSIPSRIIFVLFFCCTLVMTLQAKTIYVDVNNASGTKNGTSWNTAYTDLTVALTASVSGDVVWVAAGEYQPASGSAFPVKEGVNLFGGFDPQDAPDMAARDWTAYETVLKGNGSRVFFPANFGKNTYFDGFSLINCRNANDNGVAAYLRKGSHLVNCRIFGNEGGANGVVNLDGGFNVSYEYAPSLKNCVIENNIAKAGAVYVNTQGVIRDCVIRSNQMTSGGAGVHFNLGGRIENTIIRENQTLGSGGGIYARFHSDSKYTAEQNKVKISRCTVVCNQAALGGGIWSEKLVDIDNCVIANNQATDNGGGVWAKGTNIVNCTITNNKVLDNTSDNSKGLGGGIYMDGYDEGGILDLGTMLKSCVLWGNDIAKSGSMPEFTQIYNNMIGGAEYCGIISFSAIQALNDSKVSDQVIGSGCIHLDADNATGPRFVAPSTFAGLGSTVLNPEEVERYISLSSLTKSTAFTAGTDAHSYRIPAIATTKNGTLLVVCEARKKSWADKTPTDIVVKRSTDGGQTWSEAKFLTAQTGTIAYMDPVPVVDMTTGRIFVFTTCWPSQTVQDATANKAFLITSDDDGVTWSAPEDVTSKVLADGRYLAGFGPGAGLQMRSKLYPGRIIVPSRQYNPTTESSETRTIYSDDHGLTWKCGNASTPTGELQMAEMADGVLTVNIRKGGVRNVGYSYDGGVTWGTISQDPTLTAPAKGCQGSVLGNDSVLFYTGPEGGTAISGHDDRYNLKIWRSLTKGRTWGQNISLYANASGYSCQTFLPDGRLAIVFETGNDKGFITSASRGTGWMRLDVIVIPADILDSKCWIQP